MQVSTADCSPLILLLSLGISYMAKVLHVALKTKFPNVADKDLLKIVGNLVYYRYINSAIVAPDAFNIVDISVEKGAVASFYLFFNNLSYVLKIRIFG